VSSVDAAIVDGAELPMSDLRSGNNTSIINTSEGMREVPNSMLIGANNTTRATVVASPTAMP
jgi:hypothetical protein